jgi:hypothetical protein
MKMDYHKYLRELEFINQEIVFFESVLERYDNIIWNPFSKNAKYRRALWRKLEALKREIGALNYQFHGDESYPDPVYFTNHVREQDGFW